MSASAALQEPDVPLLIYPDPRLQIVCEPVDAEYLRQNQQEFVVLFGKMWEVLEHYMGIGLAAPQIDSPTRAIVVHVRGGCKIEIINPVFEPLKKCGKFLSNEGCLSYPGKLVTVERWRRVKVNGLDRYGDAVTFGGKLLQAAALQHEIEHLDGINIADHV